MKSTVTRLGTNNNNSNLSNAGAPVKVGGASLGVSKAMTGGGGASTGAAKQLPANAEIPSKAGGKVESADSAKTEAKVLEQGPRKKITVTLGQPSLGRREAARTKQSSVVSGGNSPIFEDRIPLPGEQRVKTTDNDKPKHSAKENNVGSPPEMDDADSSKSGVVSFSLKNRPTMVGNAAEQFSKEQPPDVNKFKSTFSEASGSDKSDSSENKQKQSLNSFMKVKNKDETMDLDWPREMIKFTKTEPSLSYSCNPLFFDFSDLLGKPSKVKSELELVSAKIDSVSTEIWEEMEEAEDEELRKEGEEGPPEAEDKVMSEKDKKRHKRKKKKHRHHKEKHAETEDKEEEKKSEKKKKRKKKKRKKKHKQGEKDKEEEKVEAEDTSVKKASEEKVEKNEKKEKGKVDESDGERGDVEESDLEDGKHRKNKHKKRRKKKTKKKKKKHQNSDDEQKQCDDNKKEGVKVEKVSGEKITEKIKKETKEEKLVSSDEEKDIRRIKKLKKAESEVKVKVEKDIKEEKIKTETDKKRKHVADDSESNDDNATPVKKTKVIEEPTKHQSRSPAVASETAAKKVKREGSGSDRRNSSLRRRQTSESSVSEATPVKKQKVTPRLVPEADVKVQDTWSKMEGLYEAKLPENPKSKWDTSDSEMESPLDTAVNDGQKKKILKKTAPSQSVKEVEQTSVKEDKTIKPEKARKTETKPHQSSDRSRSRSRSRSHAKKKKHRSYSRSYSRSKTRSRGRSYSSSSYSSRSRSYSRSYSRSRSRSRHRRHGSRSDSYSSYSDYSRSRSRSSSRSRSYSSRSRSHSRRYSSYSRSRSRSTSYSRSRSRSRSYRRSHRAYSSRSRSSSLHSDASSDDSRKKRYRTKSKKIKSATVEKKDESLDIPLPNLDEEKSAENLVQKIKDKKQQHSDLVKKGLEASKEAEKENKNAVEGKDYFDIPLPTAEEVKSESKSSAPPPPPPPGQGDNGSYNCPHPQYGGYGPHPYNEMMGPMHHSMRYPPPPHGMRMPHHHRMPPPGMYRGRGPPPHDMRYGPPPHMMNGPRGMPPPMHDGYHPRGGYPYRYPPPNANRDDKPPLPPSRSPSPQPPEPTKEEKAAEEIQPNPSIVIPPEQAEQYKRLQEQAQKHAGKQLKRLKKLEAGEPYSESSSEEEEEEAKQEEQSNDGTEDISTAEELPTTLVAIPSPSLAVPQQQTILIANPQAGGGLAYAGGLAPQLVQAGATPQHVLIPQGLSLSSALALSQAGHPLQAGAPMIAMPQTTTISAFAAGAGAVPAHLPGMFTHLGAQPTLLPAAHPLLSQSSLSSFPHTQLISGSPFAGLQTPSPVIVGNHILVPKIFRPAI